MEKNASAVSVIGGADGPTAIGLIKRNDNIHILIENRFNYIGGGASGNKKILKRFHRVYKDIYRYYGVTEEDMKNKAKRYEEVVRALSRKR